LVVVRASLTMTFFVQVTNNIIYKIQVNILKFMSWAEVFVTYHTDLTCIGYEILTNNFVYMKDRWINTLTGSVHYFTNILSFSIGDILDSACHKYIKRGFNCKSINLKNNCAADKIGELMETHYGLNNISVSDAGFDVTNNNSKSLSALLYNYLGERYAIAPSVVHLYGKEETPINILYLSIYMMDKINIDSIKFNIKIAKRYFNRPCSINKQFINIPNKLFSIGIYCDFCNKQIIVTSDINKYIICCQEIDDNLQYIMKYNSKLIIV